MFSSLVSKMGLIIEKKGKKRRFVIIKRQQEGHAKPKHDTRFNSLNVTSIPITQHSRGNSYTSAKQLLIPKANITFLTSGSIYS